VIEILTPEDRLSRFQHRIDGSIAFGVASIWIFDLEKRVGRIERRTGMETATADALTISGTSIRLALCERFAELDRAG